jgi:ribosomal protein S13
MEPRHRLTLRIWFTIALVFICGLGATFSYATIYDTQVKIRNARKILTEEQDNNEVLRSVISQRYTPDEIKRIAIDRLGMNAPDFSQTLYINVPKQSHVVLSSSADEAEPNTPFYRQVYRFISDMFARFTH